MSIINLFSKRQKIAKYGVPDVYLYDYIDNKLRVQIVHIISDAIGKDKCGNQAFSAYELIHDTLCREYGLFVLSDTRDPKGNVIKFFLNTSDYEQVLDVIEISFIVIDTVTCELNYVLSTEQKITHDEAISELNQRMQEAGVGYRYESGRIFRIDSEITHAEIVKPALVLLSAPEYAGANQEFLKAHEHYRHGRLKESISEALKAFESTMKTICTKRKWAFKPTDTAKSLIDVCLSNDLIPSFMQAQLSNLRPLLESGVPTARNKIAGHGQGTDIQSTTAALTQYALNVAAANILLFAQQEKELP